MLLDFVLGPHLPYLLFEGVDVVPELLLLASFLLDSFDGLPRDGGLHPQPQLHPGPAIRHEISQSIPIPAPHLRPTDQPAELCILRAAEVRPDRCTHAPAPIHDAATLPRRMAPLRPRDEVNHMIVTLGFSRIEF